MNADEKRRAAIANWWERQSLNQFIARIRAQGIEARQGGDVEQAPREARKPGPKDAPK